MSYMPSTYKNVQTLKFENKTCLANIAATLYPREKSFENRVKKKNKEDV